MLVENEEGVSLQADYRGSEGSSWPKTILMLSGGTTTALVAIVVANLTCFAANLEAETLPTYP